MPTRRSASAEAFVQRLRLLRVAQHPRSRVEFPSAFAVRDESELAHDERLAGDVEQRAVEAALVVLEDPQPRDLSGQALGLGDRVRLGHAEEDHEPGPISATVSPATVTDAFRTRCTTARTSYSSASPSAGVRGRNARPSLMCGVASLRRP